MKMKKTYAFILAVCILSQVACGGSLISSFKAGFAATKPFVQTLVSQGVISQVKADAAIRDIDDGINFASVAQVCISAAGSSRASKAKCYLTLATNLRTILQRHNIGGSVQLDRVAAIVEAAILAFEAYTSRVVNESVSSDGVDADKQLETDMKKVRADLKALTGE